MTEYIELIERKIEEYRDWIVAARRHIHMHPELGNKEFETTDYIESLLSEMGIEHSRVLETGTVGVIYPEEGRTGGKCIGIRADIDALPIDEATDLPFKSVNAGVMHACGHDMHTAALLGAARILSDPEVKKHLTAPVKLFFQPAEETTGGAKRMIEAGCLSNPEVDFCIGYHVMPELRSGTIGVRKGYTHASSDVFTIRVHGKTGHGAYPHQTVDAIVIASQIVTALQTVVGRNVEPVEPAVLTIGSFHAGTAGNIITDFAELKGTIRTTSADTRKLMLDRLQTIAKGVAESLGGSAEILLTPSYISLKVDDAMEEALVETAEAVIGKDSIVELKHPSMGVEDFSFFADAKPSVFFFAGTGYPDRHNEGIHHRSFDPDEAALDTAVKLEVLTGLKVMNSK